MGNVWSSLKEKRQEKKKLKRKQKLYRVMSASEREDLLKKKAEMEQQIESLNKRIHLEQTEMKARRNCPKLRGKIAWPCQSSKPEDKKQHDPVLRSKVPESERTMLEDSWRRGQWAQCPTCSHRVLLRDVAKGTAE